MDYKGKDDICEILYYKCVNELIDRDLRLKMGKNGFKFLKSEFSVEISYNRIINKFRNDRFLN